MKNLTIAPGVLNVILTKSNTGGTAAVRQGMRHQQGRFSRSVTGGISIGKHAIHSGAGNFALLIIEDHAPPVFLASTLLAGGEA